MKSTVYLLFLFIPFRRDLAWHYICAYMASRSVDSRWEAGWVQGPRRADRENCRNYLIQRKHRTHLCEVSTSHHFCSNPGRGAGLTTIVAHGTSMKIQAAGAGETRLWTLLLALTRNQAVLRWRYSDGLFYNETLCFEFRTLGSGSQPFCLPALLAWQGIYNNRCRWTTDLIFKSLLEVFILSLPFPIFFHISYFMPFHLIQHKRYLNFRVCQNNCLTFFFFKGSSGMASIHLCLF